MRISLIACFTLACTCVSIAAAQISPKAGSHRRQKGQSIDEKFLFQPVDRSKDNWKPRDLTFEDVRFRSADGTQLHAWYCPVPNPRAVVLYLHGNAGNISHRAWRLRQLQTEHRLSVFILDYRGFGKSKGRPTVAGVTADAQAARKEAARRAGVRESDIVLMGRSLGGAIAVQLAAARKPRGLIIESSFTSFREIAMFHMPYAGWIVKKSRLNSLSRIAGYQGPVLISHGDRDRTVPFKHGQALFKAATGRKTFVRIPGGGHNDPPTREYRDRLDEFIESLKPTQRKAPALDAGGGRSGN